MSKNNNKTGQNQPIPTVESQIKDFLDLHYVFRLNEVTGFIEFKLKSNKNFRKLDDRELNQIYLNIRNETGLPCSTSKLLTIVNSHFSKKFNPFMDFLNSLNEWDRSVDYIAQLADTVSTHDDKLFVEYLKKFLVGIVANIIEENGANQLVLVLHGKQGIGKSKWFKSLIPKSLSNFYIEWLFNYPSKDDQILLSESLLINIDELDSINKKSSGRLKQLITISKIKERRPYAKFREELPRRASFTAAINKEQFLYDSTGSRRFLCFTAKKINYSHDIDMLQVYAQALTLYKEGFIFWLNPQEQVILETNNLRFLVQTEEEELISEYFEPVEIDQAQMFLTATDIKEWLVNARGSKTPISVNIIGKMLAKGGFIRVKKNGIYKWAIKTKNLGKSIMKDLTSADDYISNAC